VLEPRLVVLNRSRVAAQIVMPVLAALTAGTYFLVVLGFPLVTRRLPRSATAMSAVQVRYPDGRGILRDVLAEATRRGFAIDDVATQTLGPRTEPAGQDHSDSGSGRPLVQVTLHVHGRQPVTELAAALSELEDVDAVLASDASATGE
jgi:putative Mg2+ transporter-C (MgtC) family protein